MDKLSHIDENGNAKMVDVSEKETSDRLAIASAKVILNENTYNLIKTNGIKKGDVLTVAKVAGIMAAKNTSNLIPMCHPINITGINIDFELNDEDYTIKILGQVKINAKTGVEMEALTAVTVTALTIYDMAKAVQKDIEITDIKLEKKTGGKSGTYERS